MDKINLIITIFWWMSGAAGIATLSTVLTIKYIGDRGKLPKFVALIPALVWAFFPVLL